MAGPGPSPPPGRYDGLAQAAHWITAALAAAVLPLAWVAAALPREAAAKGQLFVLHKSVGLTIFALVAFRILWRAWRPAPPDPRTPRAIALIARINHWLLYAVFIVMPVSGYLLSAFRGRATPYFWLFPIPGLAENEDLHKLFERVHLVGQWALYALVLLHLVGVVWHVAVRRDGVLDRMLPAQRRAGGD